MTTLRLAASFPFRWLRFQAWAAHWRVRLRLRGGRLRASAAGPPTWTRGPRIRARGDITLRLGHGVGFGRNVTIEGTGPMSISLGTETGVGDRVTLRGGPGGALTVGRRCQLRADAVLRFSGPLTMGDDVMIGHWAMLNMCTGLDIGSRTALAERVTIVDSDHTWDPVATYRAPVTAAPTRLGENVLVSANAMIGRGVDLPAGVIVGGGAVVGRRDWQPRTLIAGVPAKQIRELAPDSR